MKKYLITGLSLFAFVLPLVSNAELAEVYVNDLESNKTSYSVGESLSGSFRVINVSGFSQGDVFYTVYVGEYDKRGVDVVSVISPGKKNGPILLNPGNYQTFNFTYQLPKTVNGKVGLKVVVQAKDGTLLGFQNIPIMIEGEVTQERVPVSGATLEVNGQDYELLSGPTVSTDDKLNLNFTLDIASGAFEIRPVIKLYNRVHDTDLIKSVDLDSITLSDTEKTEVSLSLPLDLDPLVYAGVIEFENSDGVSIDSVYVKYIIKGDIATIINITASTDSLKDGKLVLNVDYSGVPYNIVDEDSQITINEGDLEIVIKNATGSIISKKTTKIDLIGSEEIELEIPLKYRGGNLSVEATISKDGKVLSNYVTEVLGVEVSKDYGLVAIISGILVLILLFVLLKVIKHKMKDHIVALLIVSTAFLGGVAILTPAGVIEAFTTVLKKQIPPGKNNSMLLVNAENANIKDGDVNVTAVHSPQPSSAKIYKPGDEFYINISATFKACGNATGFLVIGPPSSNNWDLGLDYYQNTTLGWWNSSPYKEVHSDKSGGQYNFVISSSSVGPYYAPTQPGTYDFYFIVDGHRTKADYVNLIKQTIVVEASCPAGQTLDSNGNCVPNTSDFSVSCSVNPDSVGTNENVTFSASASGASGTVNYNWINTLGGVDDQTGQSFTRSYPAEGTYQYRVEATDSNNATVTRTCAIAVSDSPNPGGNPDGGPSGDPIEAPTISEFYFAPAIVNQTQSCNLVLTTNLAVTSCTLNGVLLEDTNYSETDRKTFGSGTYSASCSNAAGEPVTAGPKKCTEVYDVIER